MFAATMIWLPIVGMADSDEDKKKKKKKKRRSREEDGQFPKSRPQRNEEGMYVGVELYC